jgi:hypothetical protein
VALREGTKTLTVGPAVAEPALESFTQRKREETGRFRVLVDRQLKASFPTAEAANAAGLAIKRAHPIVQVAVYDAVDCVNQVIELP